MAKTGDEKRATTKDPQLTFDRAWRYAPAPESTEHVVIEQRYGLFIGGEFVAPKAGQYFATVNPATEETLSEVALAGAADVDAAVRAAQKAQPGWLKLSGDDRAGYLFRIARILLERAREFAVLETLDNGKPIKETRDVDVPLAAQHFFYHAGWADKLELLFPGQQPEPLGVVGQVIPWNFPLLMAAWKIAPALAAGNTVVLKPAETSPLTALRLCEVFRQAGLPPGVVNVITGAGATGQALVRHKQLSKVAFTGSTEVGIKLYEKAARTVKRVSLELGGHAPFIVFDDADLAQAIQQVMASKFRNTGQTCVCANRIYVHEKIRPAFANQLAEAVRALRVGDPMDNATQIGPLVDRQGFEKVAAHVDDALGKGAQALVGGKKRDGLYFDPTVLVGVDRGMRILEEETFGPIAPVVSFTDEAEVVRAANATPFGLAAYVCTRDLGRAFRVAEALDYGIVGVNDGLPAAPHAPFGGVKFSGIGREGGPWGMDEYLDVKYVSMTLP